MKKILHKSLSLLLVLALALGLTVPVLAAPATGIVLDKDAMVLTPGAKATLTATVSPAGADAHTILWTSLMPSVATVSDTGEVTAVAEGTTAITAQIQGTGYLAMCTVTVETDYVAAVTIDPAGPESLPVGTARQLYAKVTYAHGTGTQGVTWSSADPSVATVSDTGLVTALKEGAVSIIAQTKDADQNGNTLSALYQLTVTTANPDAAQDTLVLSSTAVTDQGGQFQTTTLKAPTVTVMNGTTDVTANYTIGYSWLDGANQAIPGGETALISPVTLEDYHATCAVAAVSKTDSTKVLTGSCTYTLKVYPSTTLGGTLDIQAGETKFSQIQDLETSLSLLDQLTKGVEESTLTPAIDDLQYVVFDLDSVTGANVGTLNAEKDVKYVAAGSGKKLADVTFTPALAGTYAIEFLAYGKDTTYFGQLEIVVTGQTDPGDGTLSCDSKGFTFTGSDFFQSTDADPVASMVFGTPSAGKLLRNFVKGSGIPDTGSRYYTDSAVDGDYHVSTLSYLPAAGYSGQVEIPVTLTTRGGQVVQQTILVDVISKTASDHFSDVTPDTVGTWAANAVDFAYGCGLVNGVDATLFGPNTPMTRAMLVTVLYRAAGSPQVTVTTNFTDLDVGSYYYSAVVWASLMGIVNGTAPETFSPDAPVTRQQISAILYRYADAMGTGTAIENPASLDGYADKDSVEPYAVEPMTWAVSKGIISGMTDTTLEPLGNATRAQVTVILHRYLIGQ